MVLHGNGAGAGHELAVRGVENALADHRVPLDDLELLRGEAAGLVQDGVGDADLAHVVHGRGGFQQQDLLLGQAVFAAEQGGVGGHPAHVVGGVLRARLDHLAQGGEQLELGLDHLAVELQNLAVAAVDLPLLGHVQHEQDDDHREDGHHPQAGEDG